MAAVTATLNEGATSLADANWSDGKGFNATTPPAGLIINKPGSQSIQSGLDQSAFNIESLDIYSPFAGVIGGTGGSLRCDADGAGFSAANQISRVRVESGKLYYAATGGSTLAHLVQVGGSGYVLLTGGIVNNLHVYGGGQYNVSDQVTFGASGEVNLDGGTGVIDTHASDLIDSVVVTAGSHTLKRGTIASTGVIRVKGGELNLDIGSSASPIIYVEGGRLNWISAAAPGTGNLFLLSGILDVSRCNLPVSINGYTDGPACKVIGYPNQKFVLGGTRVPKGNGAQYIAG